MFKTSMFYTYQDVYGWAVATTTGVPFKAFKAVWDAPRSFATQAEAQAFIDGLCK